MAIQINGAAVFLQSENKCFVQLYTPIYQCYRPNSVQKIEIRYVYTEGRSERWIWLSKSKPSCPMLNKIFGEQFAW